MKHWRGFWENFGNYHLIELKIRNEEKKEFAIQLIKIIRRKIRRKIIIMKKRSFKWCETKKMMKWTARNEWNYHAY